MRISTTLLLAAALLGTPAVAQAQSSAATVRLSDPKLPFSVSVPKGWLGLNLQDGLPGVNIASAAKPPAALMRFNYLPKNGKAVNLSEQFSGFESAIGGNGATVKRLSSQALRVGGVGGTLRDYSLSRGSQNLRLRVWFGSGVKNFYSFQFTDEARTFAQRAPLFTAALNSVKF